VLNKQLIQDEMVGEILEIHSSF